MNNSTISIPLSKNGKHAGLYTAIIDECDSDIALLNWTLSKRKFTEYAYRNIYQDSKHIKGFFLHRVIMARVIGRELEDNEFVDHINGNGLCNLRSNLRIVTNQQNMMNRKIHKDNKSGYKGVCWVKKAKKFCAQIQISGKRIHLGLFDSADEAYAAYCAAAKTYHGEYARYK